MVDGAWVPFGAVKCGSIEREVGVVAFVAVVAAVVVVVAVIDSTDAEAIATAVGIVGSAVAVASFAAGCYSFPDAAVVVAAFAAAVELAAEVIVDLLSSACYVLAAQLLLSPSALLVP